MDFGHIKTEAVRRYFAWQYEDHQPGVCTVDYLNSLHAVFEMTTWQEGWCRYLKSFGELYSTLLAPLQGGGERLGA